MNIEKPKVPQIVKGVWNHSHEIHLTTLAAAVSYYSMLASIPLLAVMLTLATRLLPELDAGTGAGSGIAAKTTQQLVESFGMILPTEAAKLVSHEIARIQQDPPVALLSLGILVSLWTTSNAFMALITAMNTIHGVKETRPIWRVRARALILPIILSVVLIASLICIIGLPIVISFFQLTAFAGSLITLGQWVLVYTFVALAFGLIYRYAPNSFPKQRLITPGSIWGAAILLTASVVFQAYVANFGSYQKVYGSLGGAIVFLMWTWLVSACLLFGCVLNKTLEEQRQGNLLNANRERVTSA